MVHWANFTWEAFATLVTGLAAVGSASVVALRQIGIVRRQVELQELQLRHELFDRRAAVFNAIREYIGCIIYSDRKPNFEYFESFYLAVETSRFVFSAGLYLQIKALEPFLEDYLDLHHSVEAGEELPGYRDEEALGVKSIELRRRYEGLPSLFEPEMSLARLKIEPLRPTLRDRISGWFPDRKADIRDSINALKL